MVLVEAVVLVDVDNAVVLGNNAVVLGKITCPIVFLSNSPFRDEFLKSIYSWSFLTKDNYWKAYWVLTYLGIFWNNIICRKPHSSSYLHSIWLSRCLPTDRAGISWCFKSKSFNVNNWSCGEPLPPLQLAWASTPLDHVQVVCYLLTSSPVYFLVYVFCRIFLWKLSIFGNIYLKKCQIWSKLHNQSKKYYSLLETLSLVFICVWAFTAFEPIIYK